MNIHPIYIVVLGIAMVVITAAITRKEPNAFINLPSGAAIRKDKITAIRLGDPQEADEERYYLELKPRVIVDFEPHMHEIIENDSIEERNALADEIKKQLGIK